MTAYDDLLRALLVERFGASVKDVPEGLARISAQLVRGNPCEALRPLCGSDVHVDSRFRPGRRPS